ncbi:MAG: hypothetical protein KBT11_03240 [Treponema sp.]|nr:hypothetical protein [Candidatus Treponema equifaecale]
MKATDTFRNPQFGHNCAQAVANKYSSMYNENDIVSSYAPYVGGRAPDGLCGALFAAKEAVPEHAQEIEAEFIKICGASTCRQIKAESKTSCHVCVDTADQLVEKYSR